jgi:hypothetical protein
MALDNNLPVPISTAIQLGYLNRIFKQALTAELGFRDIAMRMDYPGEIGQTMTFTKPGLLPAATTPLPTRTNTDLTDGLTAVNYPLEQYTIGVDTYASTMSLQIASSKQAIDNLFLQNAYALGENAKRSLDVLAYNALFDSYLGYNTRVTATLGAPGVAVAVDDVRGFFENVSTTTGKVVATSASNPLTVTVNLINYTLNTVVADGTAPVVNFRYNNMTFSGSGSNTSTVPGGFSGVMTFSANVSVASGTLGNTVIAAIAPSIIRANSRSNSSKLVAGDVLNMAMIRNGSNRMRANGVRGLLTCYIDDMTYGSLMSDTEFRQYLQGQSGSSEFRDGYYGRILGVDFVRTNVSFPDTTTVAGVTIHRSILVGPEALLEADFTNTAYSNGAQDEVSMVDCVDNIAHITRPPLNYLADVVQQTWGTHVGFTCPTDTTANSTTIPTANNASRKRALVLESTEV